MTPKANQAIVNANGEYTLDPELPTRIVMAEWCITAGTATVTPGYKNLNGQFSPARGLDGVLPQFGPEGGVCDIRVPQSGLVCLKVEDAAGGFSMIVCRSVIPE